MGSLGRAPAPRARRRACRGQNGQSVPDIGAIQRWIQHRPAASDQPELLWHTLRLNLNGKRLSGADRLGGGHGEAGVAWRFGRRMWFVIRLDPFHAPPKLTGWSPQTARRPVVPAGRDGGIIVPGGRSPPSAPRAGSPWCNAHIGKIPTGIDVAIDGWPTDTLVGHDGLTNE